MATFIQLDDPGREKTPLHFREDLRQRQQPTAAADELRTILAALGITSRHAARLFAVNERSARRWRDGSRHVPHGISSVCRLLIAKVVTVDQIERAATPVSARTNGSAKRKSPAPQHAAPAPEEQPALAPRRARTATLADPSPTSTVVEQVCMLTAENCHWPLGVPGQPGFRFCCSAVVTAPYCPRHRAAAFLKPRPGRTHDAHVGSATKRSTKSGIASFSYGRHGRPSTRAPKVLFDRAGDRPGSAPPPA